MPRCKSLLFISICNFGTLLAVVYSSDSFVFYTFCREEEPSDAPSGHVTSISVLRPYRRLGLANKLMKQSRTSPGLYRASPLELSKVLADSLYPAEEAMVAHYDAHHITLHVRKSNRAAISLYRDTLGFEVHGMEKSYCMSLLSFPYE